MFKIIIPINKKNLKTTKNTTLSEQFHNQIEKSMKHLETKIKTLLSHCTIKKKMSNYKVKTVKNPMTEKVQFLILY